MGDYTDLHRIMAQLLICHGVMEESRLAAFFQSHFPAFEGIGPSFYMAACWFG
jgi:hypothetical protein